MEKTNEEDNNNKIKRTNKPRKRMFVVGENTYKLIKLCLFSLFIIIFGYIGYRYAENSRYVYKTDRDYTLIFDNWKRTYIMVYPEYEIYREYSINPEKSKNDSIN